MTPRRRNRSNEKLPPYVYKRRGCYVIGTYDPDTRKTKYERLCADDATINDIWAAYHAREQQARDTFDWIAAEFEKSTQFKSLEKETRRNYDYGKRVISAVKIKGGTVGTLPFAKWKTTMVQRMIDRLTVSRGPSAATHCARYLKRMLRWAKNRGFVVENWADGIEMPKTTPKQKLPTDAAYNALITYAQKCGKIKPRTKGSCAPYLWVAMELAYLLRMRGIEVVTLTDADKLKDGVRVERRKGSRGNVTEWNPRLKAAWEAAEAIRAAIWEKKATPTPLKSEDRPLFVSASGSALKKSSLDSAWQRMVHAALKDKVITEEERFSPHDLKRRGVTKTKGTRADKQEASGHKSEKMMDTYDHSVPTVKPVED